MNLMWTSGILFWLGNSPFLLVTPPVADNSHMKITGPKRSSQIERATPGAPTIPRRCPGQHPQPSFQSSFQYPKILYSIYLIYLSICHDPISVLAVGLSSSLPFALLGTLPAARWNGSGTIRCCGQTGRCLKFSTPRLAGNWQLRGRISLLSSIQWHSHSPTSAFPSSIQRGDPRLGHCGALGAHHWASFCDHSCSPSDSENISPPVYQHARMTPKSQQKSGPYRYQ